jgi:acetylornithine/N-succinyldiaminopimelate aminotransferase
MKRTFQKSRKGSPPPSAKPSGAASRAAGDQRLLDADRFLLPTYKRQPLIFTHGRGAYVYDSTGKKYLDFLGGIAVNGLGHAHPRIVKVIRREAGRAIHLSNLFHNAYQGPLARKLAECSGMDRVFFSNSGSEAIDGALKLARLCARPEGLPLETPSPKHRILAMENSFHGRTFGALSVTATEKYRRPFAPVVPGVEFVRFNDVADLESKFDDTVCAVILETIQGEGGIYPASAAFWNRARALATERGALLIADEIQCGLGRTGRYFAYQKFSSPPDIVLVAKPLAAGLPLGAILTSAAVAARVSPGVHGSTFGGGPLVCATALEFLKILDETKVLGNIRERGAQMRQGLEALAQKFDCVREVRGAGLILGVELAVPGAALVAAALERGLLINCTHDFTIRLLPSFLISKAQVRDFLKIFEALLSATKKVSSRAENAGTLPNPQPAHAAAR